MTNSEPARLQFDEANHVYCWDGNTVPGVTTVLGQFKETTFYGEKYYIDTYKGTIVEPERFDLGSDHGTAVHKSIYYDLTCGVDEGTLPPDVLAALEQCREWAKEYVDEIIFVEKPLYSVKHGYAGTADLYCRLKRKYGGKMAIVDFKTGGHDLSGPQTAAYEQMVREDTGYRGTIDRFVLELPKSGDKYRLIQKTGRDDFMFFKSRLFQYNYLRR